MYDELADLLHAQQVNFSYAKVHATAAHALMHDPTFI